MILTPLNPTSLLGVNINTESLGQTFTVSLVKLVAYLSESYYDGNNGNKEYYFRLTLDDIMRILKGQVRNIKLLNVSP